jgi:hypothetical protein
MITDEELAAIASALAALNQAEESERPQAPSRWRVAARNPDLEIEDYRRV